MSKYNALNPAGGPPDNLPWDANVAKAVRDASGTTAEIARLDTAATALQGSIASIQTAAATLAGRVTAAEAAATALGIATAPRQRPIVSRSGPVLTLRQEDLGAYGEAVHFANSTLIIPAGLAPTSNLPSAEAEIYNASVATRTVLPGAGVTIRPPGGAVIPAYTAARMTRVSSNVWNVAVYGATTALAGTPAIVTPPAISGVDLVGETLTVTPADFTGEDSVSRQWYRGQTPISGATGLTYVLTSDDVGYVVSVLETATNEAGSTYAGDNRTTVVAVGIWIDSVGGNDANTGNGPSQAVRTPTRLMAVIGGDASGKTIVPVNGSEFFEQLTIVGDNVTVVAVGAGPKAKFNCAAVVASFTKTTGWSNIWEAPITLPGDVKIEGNLWADGVNIQQVTSLSACNTTPARTFVADWTATETTLYLHAAGSVDPNGDGKIYTVSRRAFGILATGNNIKIIGVHCANNGHQDGSLKVVGRGTTLRYCHFSGGCRHAFFVQADAWLFNCTWANDGGNWLETPFLSNHAVCNQSDVLGETWTTQGCVWGSESGTTGFTGPLQHGANPNDLFGVVNHIDDTWRRCTLGTLSAEQTNIIRPVYDRVVGGWTCGVPGQSVLIEGGTGTINQLTNASVGAEFIHRGNNIAIPTLGVGLWRMDTSGSDGSIWMDGDTVTVLDGGAQNNNRIFHWCRGPVKITDTVFLPVICNMADDIVVAGFNGGTSTYEGAGNVYPYGSRFTVNGTGYTLAALQAVSADTTSTTAALPDLVASDDFTGAGSLDLRAGWTLAGGTADTMGTDGSVVGTLVATSVNSYYRFRAMAGPDMWVKIKLTFIPPSGNGPFVACRAIDENNGIVYRANATNHQVSTLIAGSLVLIVNVPSLIPAVGDVVVVAFRGNRIWVYVNGVQVIRGRDVTVSALSTATGVGFIRRSGPVLASVFDEISCGLVPAIV